MTALVSTPIVGTEQREDVTIRNVEVGAADDLDGSLGMTSASTAHIRRYLPFVGRARARSFVTRMTNDEDRM